jgi:hypothetical protein
VYIALLVISKTFTTNTDATPCANIAASACGILNPGTGEPNWAASAVLLTCIKAFGVPFGAIPIKPITADLTIVTGTGPLLIL